MSLKTAVLFTSLWIVLCGCSKREDLAKRLSEERRIAEAETPPSPDEFREAAMRGDTAAVLQMVERGVDVNALDKEGRTALQLASFDGFDEVVKLLLQRGADATHVDSMGRTALMFASTGPHLETVKLLIEAGSPINAVDNDERFNALMFAAAEGQLEVVEALLRAGANPNARDVDGESALDFASANGHSQVALLLESVIVQKP